MVYLQPAEFVNFVYMSSITSKDQVISVLHQNRKSIQSFGVDKLYLFGSFKTNKTKAGSDIDFLVDFYPGKTSFDNFIELAFFLEDITGRRVELLTRKSLNKHIGPHILKQAEHVL